MGQQPLTFVRQLVASCLDPTLIDKKIYPSDVTERAKAILADVGGGSLGKEMRENKLQLFIGHNTIATTINDYC